MRYLGVFAFAMILPFGAAVAEQDLDDHLPAESMPLAAESLLLDVTNNDRRSIAVGERGHILLSEDRQQWRQANAVPTRSTLTAVTTFGANAWAVGHDAVILHSADGGQTWAHQAAAENSFFPDFKQPLLDVMFTSTTNGFAIGAYGYLLRTRNGGQTWTEERVNEDDDFHLNSITRLDDGTLFIAGEGGNAYRSSDNGASWEWIEMPYAGSMFGVLATGPAELLAFGLRGRMFESGDGGATWQAVDSENVNSLFGGAITDNGRVVLVGANGQMLVRDADAENFRSVSHPDGADMAGVTNLTGSTVLIAGEEGIDTFSIQ